MMGEVVPLSCDQNGLGREYRRQTALVSVHVQYLCIRYNCSMCQGMEWQTYSVARFRLPFANCLHYAPFLIGNIAHPIRLPSRDNQVCTPSFDMPVQLFSLVNLKLARVLDAATRAVVQAFVAIYRRVGSRKQLLRLLGCGELVAILQRGHLG